MDRRFIQLRHRPRSAICYPLTQALLDAYSIAPAGSPKVRLATTLLGRSGGSGTSILGSYSPRMNYFWARDEQTSNPEALATNECLWLLPCPDKKVSSSKCDSISCWRSRTSPKCAMFILLQVKRMFDQLSLYAIMKDSSSQSDPQDDTSRLQET